MSDAGSSGVEQTENHKKRVLVVDDEPGVGRVLAVKLGLSGYDAIVTTSGAEAIEMVKKDHPDIMLLDILMPDVTGFDVLEKVRRFSDLPIIVFTARADVFKMAMDMGADDFVSKAFNPDHLMAKIGAVLKRRKPPRGQPS